MIFISHSSKDKDAALDVQERLLGWGYDASQIFLDSDAESGIPAGSKWEQTLYARLKDCRALIVVYSANWQESKWCFAELVFAKAIGKEIFPVLLQECTVGQVAAEHQAVFVYKEGEAAYSRLWDALDSRHLGPRDDFGWPPKDGDNCPFPGLPAFDERLVGVYFGREMETQTILQELRKMQMNGEPRLLMIVGASGSGKSSLLKAGVLPRLKHKTADTEWVVLQTLRYGESVNEQQTIFDQLAVNVAELFPKNSKSAPDWKSVRTRLCNDDVKEAAKYFLETLQDLTLARNCTDATVIIAIDQFEELLAPSVGPTAAKLLRLLKELLQCRNGRLLVIGTIRSDHLDIYERSSDALRAPFFLPWRLEPFPRERIEEVILKPAGRAHLEISDQLVAKLKHDTPTAEALPLLAFTLEKLYRGYASDGRLKLSDYDDLGGMEGSIQACIERLIPRDSMSADDAAALRLSFVRHLAQVNDKDEVIRLRCRWDDLPELAKPILDKFVNERLLIRTECQDEQDLKKRWVSVEVAHEAMFRSWTDLEAWLRFSADILRWRRDVRRDQANNTKWAGLSLAQLAVAREWPIRRRGELTDDEVTWIKKGILRERIRLLAAAILMIFVTTLAGVAWWQKKAADHATNKVSQLLIDVTDQKDNAEKAALKARANEYSAKARALLGTDPRVALLVAVEATYLTPAGIPEAVAEETVAAAITRIRGIPLHGYGEFRDSSSWVESVALSSDERRVAVGGWDGFVHVWDITNKKEPTRKTVLPSVTNGWREFGGLKADPIENIILSADGRWVAAVNRAGESGFSLRLFDADKGFIEHSLDSVQSHIFSKTQTSPKGGVLAMLSDNGWTVEILDLNDVNGDPRTTVLRRHDRPITTLDFSSDGRLLTGLDISGRVIIWNLQNPSSLNTLNLDHFASLQVGWKGSDLFRKDHRPDKLQLSPDERYLVVFKEMFSTKVQPQRIAEIWDLSLENPKVVLSFPRRISSNDTIYRDREDFVTDIVFSPDSTKMVSAHDRNVQIWNLSISSPDAPPNKEVNLSSEYGTMAFSPDSQNLSIGDSGGGVTVLDMVQLELAEPRIVVSARESRHAINVMRFTESGRFLLTGEFGNDTAWILETQSEDSSSDFNTLKPRDILPNETVQISDSNQVAVALTESGLWIASTLDLSTRVLPLPTPSNPKVKRQLHLSTQGQWAVISDDSIARILLVDLASGVAQARIAPVDYSGDALTNIVIDKSEQWIVASDNEKRAILIPMQGSQSGKPTELVEYDGGGFHFSPQGGWLASGTKGFRFGDKSKPVLWRLQPDQIVPYKLTDAPLENLESLTFGAGDEWLAASEGYKPEEGDSKIFVWSLDGQTEINSPTQVSGHIMRSGIKFSRDKQWMISFDNLPGAWDSERRTHLPKTLRLWKLRHFDKPVWERSFRAQSIYADFSPDSSWLTVGTDRSLTASLIDLSRESVGAAEISINSGATLVGDWIFTFSQDHQWFTTHGYNAPVRLWRFTDRKQVALVEENLASLGGYVAFSPDKQTLTASDASLTRVFWLSDQKRPLRRVTLTRGGIPIYDGSSSRLFVQAERELWVHELNPVEPSSYLAAAVGRNFTWEEWNREFPGRPYSKTFSELPVHVSVAAAFLEKAETAFKSNRKNEACNAYQDATSWVIDSGHPLAANSVAWSGSINGCADAVLAAAEFAVKANPNNGNYRDTRGVARGILGDNSGALSDFQAYLRWAETRGVPRNTIAMRRGWIKELQDGKTPKDFDKFKGD